MMGPKILFWDIETSPIICTSWGVFDQTINLDSIIEDWKIICAAWKWLGEDKVHTSAWKKTNDKKLAPFTGKDDRPVIKALHDAISQADILVAHNGDSFDWKKFQTRCIMLGFKPIAPKQKVDTLKVARKEFKFTSNKLDYIGKQLNAGRKIDTSRNLHMSVINNHPGALQEMLEYNKTDVLLLEEVYELQRPFIRNHPNYNLFTDDKRPLCPKCGSARMVVTQRDRKKQNGELRDQYQCRDCAGYHTVTKKGKVKSQ